jgi:hypothetical protein
MSDPSSNNRNAEFVNLLKSLLHNAGVVIVGLGFAFLGAALDSLVGVARFHSVMTTALAWPLLTIGFLLRVWATFYFYQRQMKVISLANENSVSVRISSSPSVAHASFGRCFRPTNSRAIRAKTSSQSPQRRWRKSRMVGYHGVSSRPGSQRQSAA